jgi:glucose/arabinose dehydrogenase
MALAMGCGSSGDTEEPPPGSGGGETITGRERLGWDQASSSASVLNTYRFAIYVDGNRSEMADVTCGSNESASGFPCSGRLPAMGAGTHVLELAAFTDNGTPVESARSAQLRVTVAGATAPVAANPLANGEHLVTVDGVELEATLVADDLVDVTDLALTQDGQLFVVQRDGRVVRLAGSSERVAASIGAADGEVLTLALAPDFARSGHIFVIQARQNVFRLTRHRLFEGQFIERMAVLPDVRASSNPTARLRFGPDGRLYAAFDDAGDRSAAAKLSEWSGKILRINPDGTTPDDQPAASPVLWSNVGSPGGLDWPREGRALWIAETGVDGVERLRALFSSGERPRRVGARTSYVLPPPVGAASLAFYRGDSIQAFRNDLFIAARTGGYVLRVRFDQTDPGRVVSTEKLLEGRITEPRAVVSSPDGALFIAMPNALWRLFPVHTP